MKKLLAVILILSFLLPSASLASDTMQMKWRKKFLLYDTDELVSANKALQAILFERTAAVDGVSVPAGIYTVGEDIPEGSYRLEFPKATEMTFAYILVKGPGEELVVSYKIGLSYGVTSIGKLELKDGMTIALNDVEAVFYTYTGLFN